MTEQEKKTAAQGCRTAEKKSCQQVTVVHKSCQQLQVTVDLLGCTAAQLQSCVAVVSQQ